MLTVLLVAFFYWSWGSPLANLEKPEESLERLVSREMDLHDVMDELSRWELKLYELTGTEPETFEDAIARFDELDEEQRSARTDLDLVVLLAENGQLERAASMIEALEGTDSAAAQYGRWLEAAYLEAPSPQDATQMADEIRRELPHDWFTDTLVRRLATRVDDPALQADAEANIEARGHALLRRVRALTLTGVVLFLLALVLLWRLLRSARGPRVAEAPLPPLWRGLDGVGLFFRAAFAYLLMPATLVLLLPRTPGSTVAMGLLGGVPMIWWIRRYLHARGETLRDTFGLRVPEGQALRVVGWGIVLLGISMAGESLVSMGLTALGVTSHWADGFLEDFLWGSPDHRAGGHDRRRGLGAHLRGAGLPRPALPHPAPSPAALARRAAERGALRRGPRLRTAGLRGGHVERHDLGARLRALAQPAARHAGPRGQQPDGHRQLPPAAALLVPPTRARRPRPRAGPCPARR